MNFSAWSIRNPVPAILLFTMLTVGGFMAFHALGIQKFPDMDLPTITVKATLDGAAPAQLETNVARKIEDRLASLSRLDHITTTITDGTVSISVAFQLEKNTEVALNEVRNAVDGAKPDLPSEMNTPTVTKVDLQSSPLLTYVVTSSALDEKDLSWFIDDVVAKAMLSAKGVGEVDRVGGVDREIHIDLDPISMAAVGVTASDVSTQLKSVQADSSGGRGEIGRQRQSIRVAAAVHSAEQLRAVTLPLSNGGQIRLDQVAHIADTHNDLTTLAYFDGSPVIGFQIKRSNGYSDVAVATAVRNTMAAFIASHPEVTIREASNTITPIEDNYRGSMELLYEGAILAIVVVWFFLRDVRATLLSAVALPLSILPTFLVIYLAGFSLNIISLLSLSLVVGILVDDAIVEIENIARHLAMGKKPFDAAMEAADEIGLAVIATTLTLVAVFLPTAFMSGIPGLIFRQFGVTAAVAVLSSLVVARLLTPMMAAYLMKPKVESEVDGRVMVFYLHLVRACLSHRKTVMAAVAVFIALSLASISLLQTGFFPASDDAQTKVTLTLPPGSRLSDTDGVAREAARIIAALPHVVHILTSVGTASTGVGMDASNSADVTVATLTVDLVPISKRPVSQTRIEATIRDALAALPGVRIQVGQGSNGEKLDITLAGDDSDTLEKTAATLETELHGLAGIGNVTSTAALQAPEIRIRPDYERMAALGVTSEAVAKVVRVATKGDYSANLPKLNLPQRQISIRVRFDQTTRDSLAAIRQLRVAGSDGSVSLGAVADIDIAASDAEIDRLDRSRNVTLSVELNGRSLGVVMEEARRLPSLATLPTGVHLVEQGELQRMSELFTEFGLAMAIGVFCIYAVLVLLFHDFIQPITILMALPLSLGGALFPLLVTKTSFSVPAVIGLLLLMGIVTKNSILLVEYTIVARRDRGMTRFDALIDACHKRARPILMTTIAMSAGMMPIALAIGGTDASFRQPMAIVVVGGVITSTVLSLLVIPVIFTYLDDMKTWVGNLISRRPVK